MTTKRRDIGIYGEKYASKLLIRNGYNIVENNFRSKYGEIDIIAIKDNTLVFVEVKARTSIKFGKPEEAVTKKKLNNIVKTSEYYCTINKGLPVKKRIEVVKKRSR